MEASQITDDQRDFLNRTSVRIATVASITLNSRSAFGMERFFAELAQEAAKVEAGHLVRLAHSCERLCKQVQLGIHPSRGGQVDRLIKESLVQVQGALFRAASSGEVRGEAARIESLIRRIRAFLVSPERSLQEEGGSDEDVRRRLLSFTHALSEKVRKNLAVGELADSIRKEAGDQIEGYALFGKESPIATDTPFVRIPRRYMDVALEQIQNWIENDTEYQQDHRGRHSFTFEAPVATLREVCGYLWVELRQKRKERATMKAYRSILVAGLVDGESFYTSEGEFVQRARLLAQMPSFQAYSVLVRGRQFLVPVGDIRQVHQTRPKTAEVVDLARVLGLKSETPSELIDSPTELRPAFLSVEYRGKTLLIQCEGLQGPYTYFSRGVHEIRGRRGFPGALQMDDGLKALFVDLFPLLEKKERIQPTSPEFNRHRFLIVRLDTRRFAIPMSQVLHFGRVPSASTLRGKITTKFGDIPFRDLKSGLGIYGERGGLFIVTPNGTTKMAWAVDAIEHVETIEPEVFKKNFKKNRLSEVGAGQAVYGTIQDQGKPVYVLDIPFINTDQRFLAKAR